jgi:hypothetical protein
LKEIYVFAKTILRLTGPALLCLGSFSAFSQQFSADMVREKPEGVPTSKVSVSGEKMRFEITSKQTSQKSVAIIDLKQESGFMILPDNKSYTPMISGHLATAMPFFRPTDPENACPAWDTFVGKPGSCSKVGDETVDNRETVKYKGVARNGDTGFAYVDRKLDFVTKWEGEKTVVAFKNISEVPQQASLFMIPSGFEKMDSIAAHQQGSAKPKIPKARTARPMTAPQATSQDTPKN